MDVRQFYNSGFNVLMLSYRGYGQSNGSPSERGFKLDALAAVEYCLDREDILDLQRIFLFGRSIGGAVAISTAAKFSRAEIAGIVVENTFTSMGDMIDVVLPPLKFFKFLNRNPWNSLAIVPSLKTPMLFISGLRDELVPPAQVAALHDAAQQCRVKQFFSVENGTHNDTYVTRNAKYLPLPGSVFHFYGSVLCFLSPGFFAVVSQILLFDVRGAFFFPWIVHCGELVFFFFQMVRWWFEV